MIAGGARRASACASCGCGDPTLTATGIEKPYANRVRLTLEERYGSFTQGDPDWQQHVTFLRSTLGLTWSPIKRLTFVTTIPWVTSWLTSTGSGRQYISGLGDADLSARVLAYRERGFAPHHLLWASAGVKFPTGYRVRAADGVPYSDDDQPGSGSWDPFIGATYAWSSQNLLSAYVSTSYRYTTTGPRGYRRGSSFGASGALQVQPWSWGALAIGADAVWTAADTLANDNASPNTGGTVVYLAPALLISPKPDWLIRLVVDAPVIMALYGTQSVGPQVALSVAWDVH